MARGVNKVILAGHLGHSPDRKCSQNGEPVTIVSIATSEVWKDKQTGESKERTEWHRVVFFNRLAEIAADYLQKGSLVYIEGSIRTRKWIGRDKSEKQGTEIIATDMQMLDSLQHSSIDDIPFN